MQRDPVRWELDVICQEAPRAVAGWVAKHGLRGSIPADQRDAMASDLLESFLVFWRDSFQYGACVSAAPGRDELEAALRRQVRAEAKRCLPVVVGQYRAGVRVPRGGEVADVVEWDAEVVEDVPVDLEQEIAGADLRSAVVDRLAWLASGSRPAWFRGVELSSGVDVETIGERDGLEPRQVYYGRDALIRLFHSDPVLAELTRDACSADLAGLCSEVLARVACADA